MEIFSKGILYINLSLVQNLSVKQQTQAAEWSSGKNAGLLKLSRLSIASDVKLEGALYSVFCAEASKRPWTSLNE